MDLIAGIFPKTITMAVELLFADMSFRDRTKIANMNEVELIQFHKSYGHYIRTEFRLPGNELLMDSCRNHSGLTDINAMQASYVILKLLWEKTRDSGALRVIK